MVIAEETGALIDDVVVYYNANNLEWATGMARDRGAGCTWAAKEAAVQLKASLLKAAAASGAFGAGVTADKLDTQNSTVFLISNPSVSFPFKKFGNVIPTYNVVMADFVGKCTPSPAAGPGGFPLMNAMFCEVAVDTQTGQVEILDWVAACDAGKVIRPASYEGQMEMSLNMMNGTALTEEIIRDPATGVLLNGSALELKPPTMLDDPPIAMPTVESRQGTGCYGAVAQSHQIYDHVTVSLAVYNAIGKWIDPPITPDKVLAALGQIPVSSVRTTGGIET